MVYKLFEIHKTFFYNDKGFHRCRILYKNSILWGEGDDRGWDDWMASPTQWTWVWVNSWSWWWTWRPGMLRFTGSQRVGHDWMTELNWTDKWLPETNDFLINMCLTKIKYTSCSWQHWSFKVVKGLCFYIYIWLKNKNPLLRCHSFFFKPEWYIDLSA